MDTLEQLGGGILQHHTPGPQLQSFDNLLLLGGGGQNDADGVGRAGAHLAQRFQSRHARHGQVQKHDVSFNWRAILTASVSVAGFSDDLSDRIPPPEGGADRRENGMIVGDHDTYWLGS
jgi:hypothetical protein